MKISFVSVFPDIFHSFVETSLIKKAQDKDLLEFEMVNPRDFCEDKHKQIDDDIYGGGAGMLLKAEPIVHAVETVIKNEKLRTKIKNESWKAVYLSPSEKVFDQEMAHEFSELDHIIWVCGRYEGIDYRFVEYMKRMYPDNFAVISLWKFITLGWEVPAMVMTEAVVRLVSGVIKEVESWQKESYSIEKDMKNLEHPQYTRPEEVRGIKVPDVLLSGHHKEIEKRKNGSEGNIS